MPIKERVLKRLTAIEQDLDRAWKNGERDAWNRMLQQMEEARSLCRKGLPESRYAVYGEIYDGMILAGKNLIENSQENAQEDVVFLFFELVRHTMEQTRKEQHFKKELVFLPYKASMWDSLESVWKAAHEDKEHCNAYVIPIPYADLTLEGGVAEWHCERGLFPEDVPTLDWQQVDLQEWHPDVIFIHNPYDNFNRVTSIESRYYSEKLKAYTDKLVYIPYFVLEEPHSGNKEDEENISHFVLNPGVVNADQVIVQSEAMREVYINILVKNTNQSDRTYWEKRISGAGSPKIDKVLISTKEDFEMPEAWRKLIGNKKIILYNTSLGVMLQNSDKVCAKLRYVFDVFSNRNDVILWWRPHPLMKATLHSMRPHIEAEYLQIEQQYIDEGWGIYDNTADLHRAICWSDAYYGDESSVLRLYRESGKPIMKQDFRILRIKD